MFEKVSAFLEQNIPDPRIPGVDLMIYHKGKLIYRKQAGCSDYFMTEPVTNEHYYFLYSCSKVMTTAAVMSLIEAGKIELDAPVATYLPAFAELRLEDGSKPKTTMTVRHCMTMTGGLDYNLKASGILETLRKDPDADTVKVVSAIAQSPLHFEPGSDYLYSLCHDVLAAIVCVVTGKPFEQYLKEWLWEPLGMKDIAFQPTEKSRAHMAAHYDLNADKTHVVNRGNYCPYILSPRYESGGAGIICRAEEYGKFLAAVATKGNPFLKPETIDLWRTPQLSGLPLERFQKANRFKPFNYALGVRVVTDSALAGGHTPEGVFGWDGAAGSHALIDPENELAIWYVQHVCGCSYAYDTFFPKLRNLIYEQFNAENL